MMAKNESTIGLEADRNDPEDFAVSEAEIERALDARRARVRGAQKAPRKELVSIRLDPDVLAAFRAGGAGWQSRINDALRKAAAG